MGGVDSEKAMDTGVVSGEAMGTSVDRKEAMDTGVDSQEAVGAGLSLSLEAGRVWARLKLNFLRVLIGSDHLARMISQRLYERSIIVG